MKLSAALFLILAAAPVAPVCGTGHCEGTLMNSTTTQLDFFAATLDVNTLHEIGGELRYGMIGQVENEDVDLRVIALPNPSWPYPNIADTWAGRDPPRIPNETNGLDGKFGLINMQSSNNTNFIPDSGLGNFRFCIVAAGTNNEVTPAEFQFTVYDFDKRGSAGNNNKKRGLEERMFMNVAQAHSYQVWPNVANSEIDMLCEDPSVAYPCPAGMRTVFHSSTVGGPSDNPSDPNSLEAHQKKRSVAFTFQNRACFDLSFEIYCPVDVFPNNYPDNPKPNICRKEAVGGGNFLFAGKCDSMIHDGLCITAAPQAATLSPTDLPSAAPSDSPSDSPFDSPSDSPSVNPSDSPVDSPTSSPSDSPFDSPVDSPVEPPEDDQTCGVGDPDPGNQGTLNLCLRTSLGYSFGNPVNFQEVNFIETLIRVDYDLSAGFCVDAFSVAPKDRELLTVSESYSDALLAYLCIASQHPEYQPSLHMENVTLSDGSTDSRPYPLTDYNDPNNINSPGTKKFNQGALINVCVKVKDEYIVEGVVLNGITSFSWLRTGESTYDQDVSGNRQGDDTINQAAIVSGAPSTNFLTSYVNLNCVDETNCDFASVLYAQFYNTDGTVTGEGDANLKFARRRLGEDDETDGRRLQEDPGTSAMDISIGVVAPTNDFGTLKTAGGFSPAATAFATVVAIVGAAGILA